jgi:hypothetical protein
MLETLSTTVQRRTSAACRYLTDEENLIYRTILGHLIDDVLPPQLKVCMSNDAYCPVIASRTPAPETRIGLPSILQGTWHLTMRTSTCALATVSSENSQICVLTAPPTVLFIAGVLHV